MAGDAHARARALHRCAHLRQVGDDASGLLSVTDPRNVHALILCSASHQLHAPSARAAAHAGGTDCSTTLCQRTIRRRPFWRPSAPRRTIRRSGRTHLATPCSRRPWVSNDGLCCRTVSCQSCCERLPAAALAASLKLRLVMTRTDGVRLPGSVLEPLSQRLHAARACACPQADRCVTTPRRCCRRWCREAVRAPAAAQLATRGRWHTTPTTRCRASCPSDASSDSRTNHD